MKTILYITQTARKKLRYYVDQCEDEISGLGKVKKVSPGVFVFYDLEIFEQVVSAAHSTIDEEALGKFMYEKTKAKEKLSEYRVWWHSHAAMKTFWSGTDNGTIDKSVEFPWLISLVTNHAGDLLARLDLFDPVRVTEQEITVTVIEDEDPELKAQCLKEIELKVRKGSGMYGYKPHEYKKTEYLTEELPGFGKNHLPPSGEEDLDWPATLDLSRDSDPSDQEFHPGKSYRKSLVPGMPLEEVMKGTRKGRKYWKKLRQRAQGSTGKGREISLLPAKSTNDQSPSSESGTSVVKPVSP